MIPKFILRAQRGEKLPIHGDGMSVRSYLYVEDVAEAYIIVMLKGTVRCGKDGWERRLSGMCLPTTTWTLVETCADVSKGGLRVRGSLFGA